MCFKYIYPVLCSVLSLCLASIEYQSFVYCIVSLQRKGKFSAICASIWIPCFSFWIIQTEPTAFWPLAGSLARHWGLTWVTWASSQSSSLIWLSQASTFYFFSSVCYHVNKPRKISAAHWQHNKMRLEFHQLKNGLLLGL